MSYSGPVRIFHYGGHAVDSYGNGAAYTLFAGGTDAFIQGDDAIAFRDEFDAADALEDLPGQGDRAINAKCRLIAELVLSR